MNSLEARAEIKKIISLGFWFKWEQENLLSKLTDLTDAYIYGFMTNSHKNSWMVSRYHHIQLSRVYPKAQRVGSDNYNPVPMWNVGSQMTALNFQTGDKPMQLNQAKFMQNGGCGYVLRPEYMFQPNYSPLEPSTISSDLTIILGMWFNYVLLKLIPKYKYFSPIQIMYGQDYLFYITLISMVSRTYFISLWIK